MKTGFVGIIGRPNVGKSTLLNAILGEKIAITTEKPQTTRNAIRGIYTHYSDDELPEDLQMIFIDTPGIHRPRTKLGSYMTDAAIGTLKEVDAIIFIVDDKLFRWSRRQIYRGSAGRCRNAENPGHQQDRQDAAG